MSDIDLLILAIAKKKDKVRDIKKIIANKNNFEYDKVHLGYKIQSLTSNDVWIVSYNKVRGGLCNCTFNSRWKEYRLGQKKNSKGIECIHILALRAWLLIHKS